MPDLSADQHAERICSYEHEGDAETWLTDDQHESLAALLALAQRTEQAEAEVREVRARERRTADEGAKRAKAQRERAEQAEKERDRLAAALEQAERAIPKNADGSADCYDGSGNGVILGLARDALASQEQTP